MMIAFFHIHHIVTAPTFGILLLMDFCWTQQNGSNRCLVAENCFWIYMFVNRFPTSNVYHCYLICLPARTTGIRLRSFLQDKKTCLSKQTIKLSRCCLSQTCYPFLRSQFPNTFLLGDSHFWSYLVFYILFAKNVVQPSQMFEGWWFSTLSCFQRWKRLEWKFMVEVLVSSG